MGHDEHFLSRLDRVEFRQVEFALSLYNDAPLVRFILDHAKVPEGAERVAISLQDPVQGPFLIVTREGSFVTCLGEGMSPRPHPVITREQLDAIAKHAQAVKERTQLAVQALQRHGHLHTIVRRLADAGEFMSREEMAALAVWQPVLWNALWDMFVEMQRTVVKGIERALLIDRPAAVHEPFLKGLWHTLWCANHLFTLLTHEGAEDFCQMIARLRSNETDLQGLFVTSVITGTMGFALRGAWSGARLHAHIVPTLKKTFHESPYLWAIDDAVLGLVACAAAHTGCAAEIGQVLDLPQPASVELINGDLDGNAAKYRWAVATEGRQSLERSEEEQWQCVRDVGGALYVDLTREFPVGHPCRFSVAEEVPDDLAATALFYPRWNHHAISMEYVRAADLMPTLARLPMEKLYFPRDVISGFVHKWDSGPMLELLEPKRAAHKAYAPPPKRAAPVPGRNEPCHCGSGKKYKKCCAA